MELRDFASHGEPGAVVYLADCVELMCLMPASCVDAVFADPPYRLSTGKGVTVKSGRLAPVDKGSWDRSLGEPCIAGNATFTIDPSSTIMSCAPHTSSSASHLPRPSSFKS